MDLLQAIFLGLLQGIVEWLPISSQGQTIVAAMRLFNIPAQQALSYAIFLHLGTLLSAIVYFRKEVLALLRLRDNQLLRFLLVALLATAITAIPSYLLLQQILLAPFLLAAIGFFLILTGLIQAKKKFLHGAGLSNKNAFFLGLGQGFSVLPGISRSGTTTAVLLFEGFSPEKAFRLSFLLSIPSVLLAEIAFGALEGFTFDLNAAAALLTAFVIGLLSIKFLLAIVRKINFSLFCILFGLLYIAIALL